MYSVGRTLQLLGLVVLPLSILAQLSESISLRQSLAFSGFGVIAFILGYFVQGMGDNPHGP